MGLPTNDPAVNADNEMAFVVGSADSAALYTVSLTGYLNAELNGRTTVALATGTALFPDAERSMSHPGWLPDGRVVFSSDGGIYAALPFRVRTNMPSLCRRKKAQYIRRQAPHGTGRPWLLMWRRLRQRHDAHRLCAGSHRAGEKHNCRFQQNLLY